jgi:hypothetical protein
MLRNHTWGAHRMRLDDSRESDNVEDGRGGGGGIRGIHLGLFGTVVVIGVGYFLGISPSTMLSLLNGGGDDDHQHRRARDRQRPMPTIRKWSSCARFSPPPRMCGARTSKHGQDLQRSQTALVHRFRSTLPAAWRAQPRGLSIVPAIARCISIWRSISSSPRNSARRASSRRPTSSRTKSVITCRISSASPTKPSGRSRRRDAASAPITCPSKSNCRRIVLPASGRSRPIRPAKSSSPAIWNRA